MPNHPPFFKSWKTTEVFLLILNVSRFLPVTLSETWFAQTFFQTTITLLLYASPRNFHNTSERCSWILPRKQSWHLRACQTHWQTSNQEHEFQAAAKTNKKKSFRESPKSVCLGFGRRGGGSFFVHVCSPSPLLRRNTYARPPGLGKILRARKSIKKHKKHLRKSGTLI